MNHRNSTHEETYLNGRDRTQYGPAQHPRMRWAGMACLAFGVFVAAACTHGSDASEHDEDSTTSIEDSATSIEDTGGDETTPGAHAPVIEQLTLSPVTLTPWNTVTVTALVSDQDGLDDIKAGLIFHSDTGAVYTSFAKVDAGVYEAEITWPTLNAATPIDFTIIADQRQLFAEFFDHDGHVGSAVFDLWLSCRGLSACDGVCTGLNEPDHCGACGVECEGECVEGRCPAAK